MPVSTEPPVSQATSSAPPPEPAQPRSVGEDLGGPSPVREGSRVVIVGGGPGGYEAALVARQLGARVTLVERQGMGGSAVLTDVVPSKTLIATAERMTEIESAGGLGITVPGLGEQRLPVDLAPINKRLLELVRQQADDIRTRLERDGVEIVMGTGRLEPGWSASGTRRVIATDSGGTEHRLDAEVVLLATGASPRTLPTARPDGERILTWAQLYRLGELPEHLVVVGSGVTGAELAGAYSALGAPVTLVSSRERVLPGEDAEAAELVEGAFRRTGMTVLSRSRAAAVRRTGDGVEVELTDGRVVEASHCLMAVGAVPNTAHLGLREAGVEVTRSGHIEVDRVSRTTAHRIYAAGDCTGVMPLASVAATQGRVAMWHALGDAVTPLSTDGVTANVFTIPQIATIGASEEDVATGRVDGVVSRLPLARNPRAKMLGITEGFVKVVSSRSSGRVLGGIIVAPRAGELIYPVAVAVAHRLTVDQLANVVTVYPSLTGSISEAARTLHVAYDEAR